MKKSILIKSIFIALFCMGITTLFSSCEQDKCKTRDVKCQNGGTCFEGSCNCPSGYEGDSCQTLTNSKFNGNFKGIVVYPNRNPYPYRDADTILVSQVPGTTNQFQYHSIHSLLTTFTGTVANNNVTIPQQVILTDTYSGTGSLNGDVITLSMQRDYTLPNNGTETFTFVGTRY